MRRAWWLVCQKYSCHSCLRCQPVLKDPHGHAPKDQKGVRAAKLYGKEGRCAPVIISTCGSLLVAGLAAGVWTRVTALYQCGELSSFDPIKRIRGRALRVADHQVGLDVEGQDPLSIFEATTS